MTMIDVFVWHDQKGNITAVGTPHPDFVARLKPLGTTERSALHLTVPEDQIERLHETHCIDTRTNALTPRRHGSPR